jgi:micrococcal nuclease
MRWIQATFLISALVAAAVALAGGTYVGKVVSIADGDTLTILVVEKTIKVRLAEIDTPDRGQPYGQRAKKYLGQLTFGKEARVVEVDQDRYGRLVGRVYVEGLDINAEMVRLGVSEVCERPPGLYRLEREARQQRRGLWASDGNIPPWQWRAGQRSIERHPSTVKGAVVGNRRSQVFHLPGCPGYAALSQKNRVLFLSREAAEAEGYRLAGNCR